MHSGNSTSETSPWVWVGCGCLSLLVMVAIIVGYFGFRSVRQIEKEMKDPVARELRAKEILGAEDFPEGYLPVVGMSIPYLMDLAILSDREPDAEGEVEDLGDRGLLFMAIRTFGDTEQELRDYFEGKTTRSEVVSRHVDIEFDEEIDRGELIVGEDRWLWVAQRGELETGENRDHDVIASMLMLECGQEKRLRFALWFEPDLAPDTPSEELDLRGTPADEANLASFLGHFHPCSDPTSRAGDS